MILLPPPGMEVPHDRNREMSACPWRAILLPSVLKAATLCVAPGMRQLFAHVNLCIVINLRTMKVYLALVKDVGLVGLREGNG